MFSNEFLAMITAASEEESQAELESRRQALSQCMQKLKAADWHLIAHRYCKGASTQDVAEALNRSAQGTRRSLQRIRQAVRCVGRKIARRKRNESFNS